MLENDATFYRQRIQKYLCSFFLICDYLQQIKVIPYIQQIQLKTFILIIKIHMGNSNTQQSSFQYILDHWEPHYFDQEFQIMRNMDDGRLAERKDIFLDMQHVYQNDADIYRLRKQNQFNLVQVYAVQKKSNPANKSSSLKTCQNKCTQVESFQILTQYIPKRITDITFYNLKEFLYAFYKSLIGLRKINSIFGKVKITERMIGINYKGQIKIWVNQNFADNMPYLQIPDDQKGDEQAMILNLAQLLQAHCQFNFQEVQNFNLEFQPYSRFFRTAIRLIQSYVDQKNLKINFLSNENEIQRKNKKDQGISNKKFYEKQTPYLQQYNPELTASNKTIGYSSDLYSNNNEVYKKLKDNFANRSEKRSPYMKLNLMQSFAKTQPKVNEPNQFEEKTSKQPYHFEYSSPYNLSNNRNTVNNVFQKRPVFKQYNTKYVTFNRQPLSIHTDNNNFPIYKRVSETRQKQAQQY